MSSSIPARFDHGTVRRSGPHHRHVRAAAARGGRLRRLSAECCATRSFPPRTRIFTAHWGINVWRIARRGLSRYRVRRQGAGRVHADHAAGAQLFLSPDRSFHRKIQEALLAIQIERRFTKQQISRSMPTRFSSDMAFTVLKRPRNIISASPPKKLTLDEAALLAGLPKAPQYYSPDDPSRPGLASAATW